VKYKLSGLKSLGEKIEEDGALWKRTLITEESFSSSYKII